MNERIINLNAQRELRERQVDTSMDVRRPIDVLTDLVEKGHLPGELLDRVMETTPVQEASETV